MPREDGAVIREALKEVRFRDWEFYVGRDGEREYLQVVFACVCSTSGKPEKHRGRKWLLSPHMTKSEIVQTAFKAVMTALEHEAREEFRYRGRAIFPFADHNILGCAPLESAERVRSWLGR